MTANLQKVTVKQAAQIMNVSERSVYMAKRISRARPDLEAEIMAGTMSLNAAYRMVTGKPKDTSFDRLKRAWNCAGDGDRQRLLCEVAV